VGEIERLRVLVDASQAFAAATPDLPALLETIAARVAGALDGGCAVLLVGDEGGEAALRAVHPPARPARAHELAAVLSQDDREIGRLVAWRDASVDAFTDEERGLLEDLAARAAVTIGNARLYRQAREAIRARDEFLSIASHELRTPVTSIKGFAQVALRAHEMGRLDEERLLKSLAAINRVSDRLAKLIEDLLDVSRLRTERMRMNPERLDLASFVGSFLARYADQLDESHHLASRLPRRCYVAADPLRLEQVLLNLLDNAVKYSPGGGEVEVRLRCVADEAVLSVRDQGVGIPDGATIFQPFGRARNAEMLAIPGMGLGLYICRGIVERLGGRIWADSPGEDGGTTVSVALPRSERRRAPPAARQPRAG
jgi:signal transduction histidine kinase